MHARMMKQIMSNHRTAFFRTVSSAKESIALSSLTSLFPLIPNLTIYRCYKTRIVSLGPPESVHPAPATSTYLDESDILRSLTEALTADVEAVFPDQAGGVGAHAAIRQEKPIVSFRDVLSISLLLIVGAKRDCEKARRGCPYQDLLPLPYVRGRENQTVS